MVVCCGVSRGWVIGVRVVLRSVIGISRSPDASDRGFTGGFAREDCELVTVRLLDYFVKTVDAGSQFLTTCKSDMNDSKSLPGHIEPTVDKVMSQVGEQSDKSFADEAPVLMFTVDADGNGDWFNRQWLLFTGMTTDALVSAGRFGFVHEEDREPALTAFAAAFEQRDALEHEYRLCHHSGAWHWILERVSPRLGSNGEFLGYIGVCLDISLERDYQRRLENRDAVMRQLNEIGERERSSLACALHDGILQDLIGTEMLLQRAEGFTAEKLASRLASARKTLRSALLHGRRLIGELSPMILDEQGLLSAIEFYAAEIENRSGVKFDVDRGDSKEYPNSLWAGNVFRIVQEAMNNIECHSGVKQAMIAVSVLDGQFCAVLSDLGIGFDVSLTRNSLGIQCMHDRAEMFGGTVTIDSSPGAGCTVTVLVPLPLSDG